MKKENKYSKALGQINPSADFENETLKKLRGKQKQHVSVWKYAPALAAVACLLVAAIALPQIVPGLFGKKEEVSGTSLPQARADP